MPIKILRGVSDTVLENLMDALRHYEANHPESQIDLYRQNSVSVRIRIIDPDFSLLNKVERSRYVWKYLDELPEETQSDLSALILLAPEETSRSLANMEFNHPVASMF